LLRSIHQRGESSIGELAALAGVQQSTASIIVARLEEAKLLRRRRSPRDARKVLLRLAPAGRELLRLAPRPPTEVLLSALADLKPAARRGLEIGLLGLERNLGIDRAPAPMLFEPERKPR
jgi:DNA-binding MarR family transcriptional regulator